MFFNTVISMPTNFTNFTNFTNSMPTDTTIITNISNGKNEMDWKVPESFIKPEGFDELPWYVQIELSDRMCWEILDDYSFSQCLNFEDFDSLSDFLDAYQDCVCQEQEDLWVESSYSRIYTNSKKVL